MAHSCSSFPANHKQAISTLAHTYYLWSNHFTLFTDITLLCCAFWFLDFWFLLCLFHSVCWLADPLPVAVTLLWIWPLICLPVKYWTTNSIQVCLYSNPDSIWTTWTLARHFICLFFNAFPPLLNYCMQNILKISFTGSMWDLQCLKQNECFFFPALFSKRKKMK